MSFMPNDSNLMHPDGATQLSNVKVAGLCSVLVPSCDAYADLWIPFFTLFWRYWPDCPFPVYLGSNTQEFDHPKVTTLYAGHGNNWTNRVREQILALTTPYVLLMLEDFFLRRPTQTAQILACFASLRSLEGEMLRLVRRPPPDRPVANHPLIGWIRPGAPYRVSTQATLWRRQTLLDLMRESETIWQFELDGSRRSDRLEQGFYCVWQSVLPYDHHVVERGKWFRHEAWRFRRMGIGCDFSRRPIMTKREMVRWALPKARSRMLELLPWPQRQRLVNLVRKMGKIGL